MMGRVHRVVLRFSSGLIPLIFISTVPSVRAPLNARARGRLNAGLAMFSLELRLSRKGVERWPEGWSGFSEYRSGS